jgi:hypothetical protein
MWDQKKGEYAFVVLWRHTSMINKARGKPEASTVQHRKLERQKCVQISHVLLYKHITYFQVIILTGHIVV